MSDKKWSRFGVFGRRTIIVAASLILCLLFLLFVRFHINHAITGDEPHYLLIDYSLQHDHDLNLKNNYANINDYYSFYPGPLGTRDQVDAHQLATNSPKLYSIHGVGLPILVLPAFILNGPKAVEVEMVIVAVIVVGLTGLWCFLVTKNFSLSLATAGILSLCYFFNGLSGYIYPDMVIAGITLGCLIILYKYYDRFIYQLIFGALIGSLVFIHFKTLSLIAPLLLLIAYRCWSHKKSLPWAVLLTAGPLIIYFFICTHNWYGVWDPASVLGSNISVGSGTSPLSTIPAMLFDSKLGLLVYNPVILLLFVGLFPWLKRNKTSFMIALLGLLPSIFLLTIFNGWDGGTAPIGRYVIDFLPAFMPAVVFTIELAKKYWQKIVVGLLILITIVITVESLIYKFPYLSLNLPEQRAGLFIKLKQQTGIEFDSILPKYSTQNPAHQSSTFLIDKHGVLKAVIDSAGLMLIIGYGYVISKPLRPMPKESKL